MPGDVEVGFEPDAGMIAASRAIQARIDLPERFDGDRTVILEGSTVVKIDLDGDHPRLLFNDRVIEADRLIVTPGAWTGQLLPELAGSVRPTR